MHLFSNLGYKYVEKNEIEKRKQYILKGTFDKEKQPVEFVAYCFPTNKKLDPDLINKIFSEANDKLFLKRVFIITLSSHDYSKTYDSPVNLTILNMDVISKYFQMLGII